MMLQAPMHLLTVINNIIIIIISYRVECLNNWNYIFINYN